jgi:hypothetical protein
LANPNPQTKGGKPDKLIRDALMAATRQSPQKLKQACEATLDKAAEGDLASLQFMADRIDGKAVQALANDYDNPLIPVGANLANSLLETIPTEQLTSILASRADDNTLGH